MRPNRVLQECSWRGACGHPLFSCPKKRTHPRHPHVTLACASEICYSEAKAGNKIERGGMLLEAITKALLAKDAGEDKKALNPVALDVSGISRVTDIYVILSGNTEIQVQAIAEAVKQKLEAQNVNYIRREGYSEGRWVLLDYGDVVVHVMHREEREFYDLERLWGDAVII